MPKAKPLDRLELTRRKMAGKAEIEKDFALREIKFMASYQQVKNASNNKVLEQNNADIKPDEQVIGKLEQHFDKCPMCGAMALVHEAVVNTVCNASMTLADYTKEEFMLKKILVSSLCVLIVMTLKDCIKEVNMTVLMEILMLFISMIIIFLSLCFLVGVFIGYIVQKWKK